MQPDIRIASTAYQLPLAIETAEVIMSAEHERIEAAMRPLSEKLKQRVMSGLGINQVHVCKDITPYELAASAATQALASAGIEKKEIGLIIDFSTLPMLDNPLQTLSNNLAGDWIADNTLCINLKAAGCGGFHVAVKTAVALMLADERLHTALLVAADSPPPKSRTLFPIAIQGDAGSAVVLSKNSSGSVIISTDVRTLGYLHSIISLPIKGGGMTDFTIQIDSTLLENELLPIYYLNFFDLIHATLKKNGLQVNDISHFIYSNISETDQNGFIKALSLPPEKVFTQNVAQLGHTFGCDLVINYTDLCRDSRIKPGQWLLFASAGIGFTWGVTLARA